MKINIIYDLHLREMQILNNRHNLKIIRKILTQKDCQFKKIWEKHSTNSIAYEAHRIYFDHYQTCMSICGYEGVPQCLYKLPPRPSRQRIQDALICEGPLVEIPLEHQGYRNSFLTLTADNWLLRYDNHTGVQLQQVFISQKYKFRYLVWESEKQTIVAKSTLTKPPRIENINTSIALLALAVFTVFPFEFIGLLEIKRNIFGKDVSDAIITDGMLVVEHQNFVVKIYSFEKIVQEFQQFPAYLDKKCENFEGIVGHHPLGLPVNILISECPPVLFDIRCRDHEVQIFGYPWHYIFLDTKPFGPYKILSLDTNKLAQNGILTSSSSYSVDPETVIIHPDNSERIIHKGANHLRVLYLKEVENEVSVELCFCIDTSLVQKQKQPQETSHTSSGRKIKWRTFEDTVSINHQSLHTFDYENDLDLLAVTAIEQNDQFSTQMKGCIYLHDNQTGQLLASVELEEPWGEFSLHGVFFDLDTLIHIVKDESRNYYSCYVYKPDRLGSLKEFTSAYPKRMKKST